MNWYKKAQQQPALERNPYYTNVGHYNIRYQPSEEPTGRVFLWISNTNGDNFNKAELAGKNDTYDHSALAYDTGLNMATGVFQGRYDESKNIISISYNPQIFSIQYFPNRLINRLKKEFGASAKMIDYSHGTPEIAI